MKKTTTLLLLLIYGSLQNNHNKTKIVQNDPNIYESTYHQWRIINKVSPSGQKLVTKEITHIQNCKHKYQ